MERTQRLVASVSEHGETAGPNSKETREGAVWGEDKGEEIRKGKSEG